MGKKLQVLEIIQQKIKNVFPFLVVIALTALFVSCKSSEATAQKKDGQDPVGKLKTESDSIKFTNTFINANRFKITGDIEKAQVYFERCYKMNPLDGATLYELAQIYEVQNGKAAALEYVEKAVEVAPENMWYLSYKAYLLDEMGENAEAAIDYEKLAKNNPDQLEYYYNWANNLIFSDQLKQAVKVYDLIEEKMGITEEISLQKEKIYLNLNDNESAVKEVEKLIEYYPNSTKYYGELASLYKSIGEKEKAIETYEKLKKIDPDNPLVELSLSEYYFEGGEVEKAHKALRNAFGNETLDIDTKVQVILSFYENSAVDETLNALVYDLCDSIVTTHPEEAKGFALYGDIYNRDNRYKEAREMFVKSIALDNSRYMVWNEMLFIDAQLNDYDSLAAHSEKAMELFPSQPVVYLYNGIANLQLEDYDKAVLALEQGKSLVVNNPALEVQFYANLGDTYHQLKKYQQSYINYDKALSIDPSNTYVLNNYAYFLSLNNEQLEKAKTMIEKCLLTSPNSPSYLDTYAWVLYRMDRFDKALEMIDKAYLYGGKESGEVVEHYGDILYKLNRVEEAVAKWQEAFKLEENEGLKEKIQQRKILE